MALSITYVPATHKPGRSLTPVPADVAAELDRLAASQTDPTAITIARLDSPEERDRFVAHLRSWADARAVRVRKVKGGLDDPSSYAFRIYPAA